MQVKFFRLRFRFEALETVRFPEQQAANVVRGALGTMLRETACAPGCTAISHCPGCDYARIFEPRAAPRAGPSGFADRPRPFVLRARHLDGRCFNPGEQFFFDVHLFDTERPSGSYFARALVLVADQGLGPGRGRAALARVEQLDLEGEVLEVFEDGRVSMQPTVVSLIRADEPVRRARVTFLTPTELKSADGIATRPDFAVLFARIRDRLSSLSALYGQGPLPIDFRGMEERSARVAMTRCDLQHQNGPQRRSSRTGQAHPLGGFTGEVEYEGDLAEFAPYLLASRWTGVGRHTVWGNGETQFRPA